MSIKKNIIQKADVAILGGGPAGSSTAIELAKMGYRAIILERSNYHISRIGETLPPMVRNPLIELGVWENFLNDNPISSPGIVSVWGNQNTYENDFIVNPYGNGWHIDRCRFDETLVNKAQELGVCVCRSTEVSKCVQSASKEWEIEFLHKNQKIELKANFLVEATGRLISPARQIQSKKFFYDKLVGVVKFFQLPNSSVDFDQRTLIESSKHGWWYSALLPNNKLVIAYMTDGDQIAKEKTLLAKKWQKHLLGTFYTKLRLNSSLETSDFRIVAANSYQKTAIVGVNHLSVGDAATTFDPLSGQGIFKSLVSGIEAAKAIKNYQQYGKEALDEYEQNIKSNFKHYLEMKSLYYRQEQRWNNSTFWKRRHSFNF